jgi:hypothetical protein
VVSRVVLAPDVVEQLLLGDRAAWVRHQVTEHGELARGEVEKGPVLGALMTAGIECERPVPQNRWQPGRAAPQQRAQVREQHRELEGLGEIVVGADIEARHVVGRLAERAEHQHRQIPPGRPELRTHAKPAEPRQHDVEDHRVIVKFPGTVQTVDTVRRHLYRVPFGDEPAVECARRQCVVLNHENPHMIIVPHHAESTLKVFSPFGEQVPPF